MLRYIQSQLEQSTTFLKSLGYRPRYRSIYPKFAVVSSTVWPTPTKFLTLVNDNRFKLTFPILERGDGVVPEKSTAMPEGYEYVKIKSSAHHAFLLNDLNAMERALRDEAEPEVE